MTETGAAPTGDSQERNLLHEDYFDERINREAELGPAFPTD
jgi:hypothetical protein